MVPTDLFGETLEDLLQARDLILRFREMRLKRLAQFRCSGRLRQLRQRLRELPFCVVGVSQFVDERIVQRAVSAMVVLLWPPSTGISLGETDPPGAGAMPARF